MNYLPKKNLLIKNPRQKRRATQLFIFISFLLLIGVALALTVSRIGQSQDNRQQAWDGPGGDPYALTPTPTPPTDCFGAPVLPEGCGEHVSRCAGCRADGIGCDDCEEYNNFVKACERRFNRPDNCDIISDSPSDPVVTEAPTKPTTTPTTKPKTKPKTKPNSWPTFPISR